MSLLQCDRFLVQSNLVLLADIQERFRLFCLRNSEEFPWLKDQLNALNLALAEGFTNAVRHAHRGLPQETPIEIVLSLWSEKSLSYVQSKSLPTRDRQRLEIRIWDHGPPFDPDSLEEPQPGTLRQGGYGWFLLRRLADRVIYERDPNGHNCLLIVKFCNAEE